MVLQSPLITYSLDIRYKPYSTPPSIILYIFFEVCFTNLDIFEDYKFGWLLIRGLMEEALLF
jgi:hypothetical protein